jgi:hypothetical protein
VWARRTNMLTKLPPLDGALVGRAVAIAHQRPRERRKRRTSRTVGSRGDPSSGEPPDEPPDDVAAALLGGVA